MPPAGQFGSDWPDEGGEKKIHFLIECLSPSPPFPAKKNRGSRFFPPRDDLLDIGQLVLDQAPLKGGRPSLGGFSSRRIEVAPARSVLQDINSYPRRPKNIFWPYHGFSLFLSLDPRYPLPAQYISNFFRLMGCSHARRFFECWKGTLEKPNGFRWSDGVGTPPMSELKVISCPTLAQ